MLKNINFGDVDAKNEVLKQKRFDSRDFFNSYYIPKKLNIEEIKNGSKFFIKGLKGTGKTALIRYLHDICSSEHISEIVLFKSHITEDDKQALSNASGYTIVSTGKENIFLQDFKEAWKWFINQKIAQLLYENDESKSEHTKKLYKLTGVVENKFINSIGKLFSSIKAGSIKLSMEAAGAASEIGIEFEKGKSETLARLTDLNIACRKILNKINYNKNIYIYFDELELFHENDVQFDRDRRIIRDLIYAISHINSESSENGTPIYLNSTLRSEVLHSILELGHEIGRDIDDYGIKLDWSEVNDNIDHPLMLLIRKKIAVSMNMEEESVWGALFPKQINNQDFYKFILNSSYYRPRDIVRLLRVARDYRDTDECFTTEHFDRSAAEYSRQTWLEITEELLATYSADEISAIQRFFLGFNTHFYKDGILERKEKKYQNDEMVQKIFHKYKAERILGDLYRIGVVGNDFYSGGTKHKKRNRWIFRGDNILNDSERMTIHKSLWKHLSLVPGTYKND